MAYRAAEAVALALEGEVGVRDAVRGERRRRSPRPGLGGTTRSSRPWRTSTGQRISVDGVDRRALAIDRRALRVRADEPVSVVRLELVGVAARGARGRPTPNRLMPGREDVAEGERGERRVAAGAAALDRQPLRVDVAALDEEAGRRDARRRRRRRPTALEAPPVLAAVAGAAAVVDVDDGDAAAGQELLRRGRARSSAFEVGPPWDRTTSGGRSPSGPVNAGLVGG